MGKAENFKIDMEDDVVSRAMVTYNGAINWPPKPLPVSPQKPKVSAAEETHKKELSEKEKLAKKAKNHVISLAVIGLFLFLLGKVAPSDFMGHFSVFVLAVFVGWQVIWNVTHALHTPLMSVTNAISGIIIIGGLLQVQNDLSSPLTILAFFAILVASINIVGGFFVTHRMLKMFRK